MSFASLDSGGGHSSPRPKPSGGDLFGGFSKPAAPAAPPVVSGPPAYSGLGNDKASSSTPIYTNGASPADFSFSVPEFVPGGIGPSDGGLAGFTMPDLSGVNATQHYPAAGPVIDFNALLQKALGNMGFSQLDSNLQKSREQLIARFGDPTLAGLAGFGLDPQAGAFAQQNYLSGNADLARLDKQREKAKKAVVDRLAGRGLQYSGDLGHGLNEEESQYGNARYDLTQSYLQKLSDLLSQTLQQKQQIRSNVVNALMSAYGQYAENPEDLVGLYGE